MIKNRLFLLISLIIICVLIGFFLIQKKQGTIILLNGTSSSGKSAILKELHAQSPDIVVLKVDDYYPDELIQKAMHCGSQKDSEIDPWSFLHQYLIAQTDKYYFDTELREQLFSAASFFYPKAKELAAQGKTVIIDTVLEHKKAYQEVLEYFKDDQFHMALIYCPMDILLERVQARNCSGVSGEQRNAFLSFEQFPHMYKLKESDDEPVIDRVNTKTLKNALEASIQDLIKQGIAPEYLPKLQEFKNNFIAQFKLNSVSEIEIAPQHCYKQVFKNDSLEKAQEIAYKLKLMSSSYFLMSSLTFIYISIF